MNIARAFLVLFCVVGAFGASIPQNNNQDEQEELPKVTEEEALDLGVSMQSQQEDNEDLEADDDDDEEEEIHVLVPVVVPKEDEDLEEDLEDSEVRIKAVNTIY